MKLYRRIVLLFVVCVVVSPGFAATISPQMVGTYVGKLVRKVFRYNNGLIYTERSTIQITLNSDDTFDVLVDGEPAGSGTGKFGPNAGYLTTGFGPVDINYSLHFKNGTVKGLLLDNYPAVMTEGKFSAKKQ